MDGSEVTSLILAGTRILSFRITSSRLKLAGFCLGGFLKALEPLRSQSDRSVTEVSVVQPQKRALACNLSLHEGTRHPGALASQAMSNRKTP
jgi:hypothetical protein